MLLQAGDQRCRPPVRRRQGAGQYQTLHHGARYGRRPRGRVPHRQTGRNRTTAVEGRSHRATAQGDQPLPRNAQDAADCAAVRAQGRLTRDSSGRLHDPRYAARTRNAGGRLRAIPTEPDRHRRLARASHAARRERRDGIDPGTGPRLHTAASRADYHRSPAFRSPARDRHLRGRRLGPIPAGQVQAQRRRGGSVARRGWPRLPQGLFSRRRHGCGERQADRRLHPRQLACRTPAGNLGVEERKPARGRAPRLVGDRRIARRHPTAVELEDRRGPPVSRRHRVRHLSDAA